MIAFDLRTRQNVNMGRGAMRDLGITDEIWVSDFRARGASMPAGRSREDIDLELALRKPARAREYIRQFDWGVPDPPDHWPVGVDGRIWFSSMTDKEAVIAALQILIEIERPGAHRISKMLAETPGGLQ
jgi:hypothetical protein